MKNGKIVLVFLALFVNTISAKSQVLEVVEALGGVLLPKVISGIKEIKDLEKENKPFVKVDKTTLNQEIDNIHSYISGITGALEKDARTLEVLGGLSNSGGQIFDDLNAMESMANAALIDVIISSNSYAVQRAYAQAFYRDLQQYNVDINKLQQDLNKLDIEGYIKNDLTQKMNSIKSKSRDFESFLNTSGLAIPQDNTSPEQINSYLEKIKSSTSYIVSITENVQGILGSLHATLGSFTNQIGIAKADV